jgi:tetratricopeptide (TPR) repeat protein
MADGLESPAHTNIESTGMTENPRIEALRRRIEKDPASIAFAQLAEEYRRGGNYQHAITICREGLTRHPGYLSAQVTLGRALIELLQFDEARKELEAVLSVAPDNLAAIRALADIHQRVGDGDAAGEAAVPAFEADPLLPPEDVELTEAAELPIASPPPPDIVKAAAEVTDPALPVLEQWLTAIVADRARWR